MVEISNVKVYDLEESINACRNSMRIVPDHDDFYHDLVRAERLCNNPMNSGEINFLKGIRVSFDKEHGDGWLLLRLSVHDPIMPLNIESDSIGGVEIIKEKVMSFLKTTTGLDLGK